MPKPSFALMVGQRDRYWCSLLSAAAIAVTVPARASADPPNEESVTTSPSGPESLSELPPESAAPERSAADKEPTAPAPTPKKDSDFGAELRGQMGFGGEKIAEVEYSDGSSSDLSLGTYFFLGIGGIYSPWRWQRMGVDLELLAGWGSWSTGPENTDDRIHLSRFPVEALAYYRHLLSDTADGEMLLRVGGGVSYHLIGGVTGTGSLEDVELDFDNALGGVLEASFLYTALAGGIRYTPMKYRTTVEGQTLDASSIGIFFSLQLEPGLY